QGAWPCPSTNLASISSPALARNAMPTTPVCQLSIRRWSRVVWRSRRTVTNLLERYDELVALSLQDTARLRRLTQPQGRVILALDGLQPDVGQEVLWVLRDCLSGEVLLARSLLSATHTDNWLRVFRSPGASRSSQSRRQQQHTRVVGSEKCAGLRCTA